MEYSLRDVREPCSWSVKGAFDVVSFELSRAAIANFGTSRSLVAIDQVGLDADHTAIDETIVSFGLAAAQAIENVARFDQFYIDHLLEGVCAYVALRFFGIERHDARKVGLAAWQERRAKEMMTTSLGSYLSLKDIAKECGLSVGHFSRAFRQSTGRSPHKWFLERRIGLALQLLAETNVSLAEVASQCGFADQSHLTNVFSRRVGIPPGTYRRKYAVRSPTKAPDEFSERLGSSPMTQKVARRQQGIEESQPS
jgi:AraC-like DNA-binding protein